LNLAYTIKSNSISDNILNEPPPRYGNLEISNKLEIQMSTVSTYKNRIFDKLDINNVVVLSKLLKENSL
jgi:hypothetical protein